jgi:hypothetical protein
MSRTSVSPLGNELDEGEELEKGMRTFSISSSEIPWLISPKNPSVSAAWTSWAVISSTRDSKSWREILGMLRSAYLVGAIVALVDNFG